MKTSNFLNSTLLLLTTLFSSNFSYSQTTLSKSFVHDGATRTYDIYIPASYNSSEAVPLILNLHGRGSNAVQHSFYSNFNAVADTANFILVSPNGSINPIGSEQIWNIGIFGVTADDKGFLSALVDTISANYSILQNRIYATGMSNGGYMSYVMACETNRFAAIASVTGTMTTYMYNNCNSTAPIPTMLIHGTADAVVPYAGNSTSKSVEEVTAFWADRNGCDATPIITNIPNTVTTDNSTAERYLYANGNNGHTVELFIVTNGGHTWPGAAIPLPGSGNTCMDFSATKEIWRFFSQYERAADLSISKTEKTLILVYPNPVVETVYFDAPVNITSARITDLQGRTIVQKEGKTLQSIDVKACEDGMFFLILEGENFSQTVTIQVQ